MFDYFRALDGLADEEREIHATVRAFVDEAIVPNVQGWWDGDTLPRELITQMGELGILGPTTPAEYGGSGISSTAYGLICYELERGDSGVRSSASVQGSLVMYPIYAYGSEEQKRRYLPELASGAIVGCFGLTESDGGSDPGAMRTRARRDGDGYVLNGSKMWITNSPQADVAVVWAKDDDGVVQGFLVESDATGFSAPVTHSKASLRASITGEIVLEDVRVPASARFPVDGGLKYPLGCLTQARYGIAWGVIGAAQACLAQLLDYTRTRVLFGRPLAQNQAIQIRLAEMARRMTAAQLLAWQLGRLKDQGELQPVQVSLAKWNNCRMALEVACDCRDMLGGSGISVEYVPMRHMLNLESVITYEGTETIHQLSVGRELTGLSAF